MDDISKVTNSILPTATELHSAVIKSLNEFDGNSYKKLKNNFKNYRNFTRIIPSYIASIESVLETLTTNVDIDPSLINVVNNISESNAASPDMNSSKPTGLSIIDSINQVSSVVHGIQSAIDSLVDTPLVNPISIAKMHMNISMIGFFLNDTFQLITKTLQDSNIDYKEINDVFGGTSTLENIKVLSETKDSTESSTPEQIDQVIERIKSKDKVSITEALTDIINIIGQVLSMPMGFIKLLIFKRKITKLTELLADSINTILNGLKGVNLIEFLNQMKLLAGADGSLPLLNKSLDIISEIMNKFKTLPKISIRKVMVILNSLYNIQTIINKIAELEVSDETEKKVTMISNIVDNLKHIFLNIILLGLLAIPVMIASVAVMASILFVSVAIWVISKVLPKEVLLNQTLKKLTLIESIFWNLKFIYISIAILGLLAIPLIVFFVPIMISILLVTGILILLQWCLKAVKPTQVIMELILISVSIVLLIVIVGMLVILGILGGHIMSNIVNILIAIGAVIAVLLLFTLLGFLAQFILPFLLAFLGAVAIIVLSVAAILIIAILLIAISNIKLDETVSEKILINLNSIFDAIGVIGSAVWDNVGSLLSIAACAPLLLGVVAALIPIILIGAQLLLISKINIPDNISEKLNELFNVIIGTGEENSGSLSIKGFIKKIDSSLSKKEVRRVKNIMRNIKNIVRNIYRITQRLNDIQNAKPDKEKIMASLTNIFEVILGGKFGEDSEKEFSLVNSILTLEAAIENRDTLRRCNGILRNIESILGNLRDIIEYLNEIQNLKADKEKIIASLTDIFEIILGGKFGEDSEKEFSLVNSILVLEAAIENRDTLRRCNGILRNIESILSNLRDIIEYLNEIQNLKADKEQIMSSLNDIFEIILGGKFGEDSEKEFSLVNSILTLEAAIENRDTLRRCNGILRNIESILGNLQDLIVYLNEIQNLKADKEQIMTSLNDIFEIILGGKFGEDSEKEFSLVNSILTLEAAIEDRRVLRRCNSILRNIEDILSNLQDITEYLNEIQNLKADKKLIMASLTDIFEVILGGKFGEDSEKEFSLVNSILVLEAAIEDRGVLRRCNSILRYIEDILSNLQDLIGYLNEIQNLKPDKEKIMTSLNDIFEVILGGKFGEESEKEFSLVNSILKLEAAIEDRRVLRRCDSILGSIDNILLSLSEITNSLNSIKDFNVEKTDIKAKLSEIFSIVELVGTQVDTLLFKDMNLNTTKNWWERRQDRKMMDHKNDMMEKANEYLGNIGAILSTLSDITISLNSIKDFNIEDGDILKKLQLVFGVVKKIGSYIDKFLFKDMNLNITKNWWERRQDRKMMEHKTDMLEKLSEQLGNVGAILSTVSNITNSLNSIKDFDIKENDIIKKLQSVFSIVKKIGSYIDKYLFKDMNLNVTKNWWERIKDRANANHKNSMMEKANKQLGNVGAILSTVSDIANGLNSIKDMDIKSNDIIKKLLSIFKIVRISGDQIEKITDSGIIGTSLAKRKIADIIEITKSAVEDVNNTFNTSHGNNDDIDKTMEFMNASTTFVEKIQRIDNSKLIASTNAFKSMAKFAKIIRNNFDELADSLNEKIAPLLEEMNINLDKVNGSVKETSSNVATSVNLSNQRSLTQSQLEKQVSIENPNATREQIRQEAQERHVRMERMQLEENSIMQEILDHLKNGKLQVVYS